MGLRRIVAMGAVCALLAACDPTVVADLDLTGRDARIEIVPVGAGTAYPLTDSWRPGCPVGPDDLRGVEFDHWRDDGTVGRGVLIVHVDVADDIGRAMNVLYRDGFPLTSARPVSDFGGSDDASMAADNSSGFNCRFVAGTSTWSEHAYGRAVDLNPIRNPYVRGSVVDPPGGKAWLDRDDLRPGMLVEGHAAVEAFDRIGWGWGGRWNSVKDYQHLSATGR